MSSAVMLQLSRMNFMPWIALVVLIVCIYCHIGSCMWNCALRKPASQSTTLDYKGFNWTADKAVDGNTTESNPEVYRTCSATEDSSSVDSSWEVDIGSQVIVKAITVYGRLDGVDQTSGFQLYVGNESKPWNNSPLQGQQTINGIYNFTSVNSIARYVSVRREKKILVICEVTVEGECLDGNFSEFCNQTCGECYEVQPCNKKNGDCPGGCDQGWKGTRCDKRCEQGEYGYGCNDTCGHCFSVNYSCNGKDGRCIDGCQEGWKGLTCKEECEGETFGSGCNETCGNCLNNNSTCSKRDGKCLYGCEAGWRGETCKIECESGTFGSGCNKICGQCLNGNSSCLKTDGRCMDGCKAGWHTQLCQKTCKRGTFGSGCNETCGNCLTGNSNCSKSDGQCMDGCEAGWHGETCKIECDNGTYGLRCNETCGNCLFGYNNCSKANGHCFGGCQHGWGGNLCKLSEGKNETTSPPDNNKIVIAVVVPVMIVLIIVTVMVVLTIRRMRSKHNEEVPATQTAEQKIVHTVNEEGEINDTRLEGVKETLVPQELAYKNTKRKTELMAQCILVPSFWAHVMKKKANKEDHQSEFQELTQGLSKTHNAALANPSKNRYKYMYPYDFNRVVLKRNLAQGIEHENDSDYINASHIKGYEGCKCYIAAQGPTDKTVVDFWWMVWQERTECIVMLTNLIEMGKVKCIRYWPDEDEQMHGDVTVKVLRTEVFLDYVRRDLQITVGGKSRKVTQFHYKAWPDKDVPDTAWSLVGFWKAVRKHTTYGKDPMLVHCSAGIGRTGTFIALDIIYEEACENGHVAVIKCVENLREQRVNMVQTENQCMFLYDVVAEALGFGTMPVLRKQFSDVLRHLMEKDEKSGLTLLQRQYTMLTNVDPGRNENNVTIYTNDEGFQSEKIWLPNLSGRDAYFIVQWVSDEKLLAIIRQRNFKCLINIDNTSPKDVLFSLGVSKSEAVGGLTITCSGKEDMGAFERKQFAITGGPKRLFSETVFRQKTFKWIDLVTTGKMAEEQTLTMFSLKNWEESYDVPSDWSSVMTLMEDVIQWHPSPNESNPVLLCSRSEVNRCGVMYILLTEKDRIRRDGEIFILRTSADMLARNRTLLPTFGQYVFVHKCLATDTVPEATYDNTAAISGLREIL